MTVEQVLFCVSCGASVPPNARFCPYCGTPSAIEPRSATDISRSPGTSPFPGTVAPPTRAAPSWPATQGDEKDVPLVALPVVEPEPALAERPVVVGALLVLFGAALGLIGLFFSYTGTSTLVREHDELSLHALLLFSWAVVGLVVLCAQRTRTAASGTLFGLGISVVSFGYYFSDLGAGVSAHGGGLGPGFLLSAIGWFACLVGGLVALSGFVRARAIGRFGRPTPVALVGLVLAIGVACFYWPSWDRFVIDVGATHRLVVLSEGNAFSNPGLVITGDVFVMVTLVALGVLAALGRPRRYGVALLAGAAIPMLAEVLAAFVQWTMPVPYSDFGLTPAQVSADGITLWMGFTWVFVVEVAFVAALCVVLGVLWRERRQR